MEKRTIYIHKNKDEDIQKYTNNDYRVVTFIGGNNDIVEIIKKLIQYKINS